MLKNLIRILNICKSKKEKNNQQYKKYGKFCTFNNSCSDI